MKKYVWLISENVSTTMNNNSFYYWKYIVNTHNDIDAFFLLEKNENTTQRVRKMNKTERDHIVWRNTIKHAKLFRDADMYFVSLSYRDVQPDKILFKSYKPPMVKPLVYLQHGICAIKQLDYKANYANNSLFRFVYYNPQMLEKFQEINGFKKYQLYYGEYLPRYSEMVRRHLSCERKNRGILWFLTWRDYFKKGGSSYYRFIMDVYSVVNNQSLLDYLEKTQTVLTLCVHMLFLAEFQDLVKEVIDKTKYIRIVTAKETDIMDEIVNNDVLITDYSSLGFEFTLLNKPVILYQNDFDEYVENRELYCTQDELRSASIQDKNELVNAIVNEQYGINNFYRERLPEAIDLDKIASDYYIEQMYQYFYKLQTESIMFIGYDFSGIGGTVFATNALAEGFLEQGYLVRYLTLKRNAYGMLPAGVTIQTPCIGYKKRLTDKIMQKAIRLKYHYHYLKDDPAYASLRPVSGFGMKYWLNRVHVKTVISTRESLHFFLNDAKSPFIQNRIFFFHAPSELVETLFPGVIERINKLDIGKAVFVTQNNKDALAKQHYFDNYQKSLVLGNGITSSRSIEYNEIRDHDTYPNVTRGCFMLRISEERSADIDRLIAFGLFVKEHGYNIVIDVYGTGNYLKQFIKEVMQNSLSDVICYQGVSYGIKEVYNDHLFAVDFSTSQSFGMVYIEAILNGRMVYCYHNEGSDEVLKDIPECYFSSFEELAEKIDHLKDVDYSVLEKNYEIISKRYSRSSIAARMIEFINE